MAKDSAAQMLGRSFHQEGTFNLKVRDNMQNDKLDKLIIL